MRKLAQFKELGKLIVYDKEKFSGWGGVYIIVDRKNKKVYVGSAFKFTEAYRRHFTEYVSRDYQKMYIFDKGHLWDKEKLRSLENEGLMYVNLHYKNWGLRNIRRPVSECYSFSLNEFDFLGWYKNVEIASDNLKIPKYQIKRSLNLTHHGNRISSSNSIIFINSKKWGFPVSCSIFVLRDCHLKDNIKLYYYRSIEKMTNNHNLSSSSVYRSLKSKKLVRNRFYISRGFVIFCCDMVISIIGGINSVGRVSHLHWESREFESHIFQISKFI